MEGLIKLAVMVLSELQTAQRFRAGATRTTAAAACAGLALIAIVAAIGALVASFWIYLLTQVSPAQAALLSGALLLVIALILIMLARNFVSADESGLHARPSGEALVGEMQGMFERHKGSALLAALLAGLAAGNSRRR